jgi:hypothetical protein
MPTTRKRRSRGRAILTMDSIDIPDILSLLAGWRPPQNDIEARSRWSTWPEFFGEYELLRDEFLAFEWTVNMIERGEPIFAEEEYQCWLAAGRPAEWRP